MEEYELWLDESGDFEKDLRGIEVPSIVGGLLFKKNTLLLEEAKEILDKHVRELNEYASKWVHSIDISPKNYGPFATNLLSALKDKKVQFVVFENLEQVEVVNTDLTYLHILSEGIIQLFQSLSMSSEKVSIDIFAASRVRTSNKKDNEITYIIKQKEYKERLQEKIDLGLVKRNIRLNRHNWKWTFAIKSARIDHRLMLADVVCHTWFRRNGNKFNNLQREKIKALYNPLYHFSAIEKSTYSSIKRQLSAGAVGEALYEWLMVNEEWNKGSRQLIGDNKNKTSEEYLSVIINRLNQLPDYVIQTQLAIVLNHIKMHIQLERKLDTAKELLIKIQEQVITEMQNVNTNNDLFFFNVNLMLFTNSTHQGDIELSEIQRKQCRKYIVELSKHWEYFSLVLDYYVREAVHLLNSYDYIGVIDNMNHLENLLENTVQLFPIAIQEDLNLEVEEMNSDIMGKVLGTRLQAYCFDARVNPHSVELARGDSDRAIEQFSDESDLKRQYQYRSQIECEAGNFKESINWLGKSVGIESEEDLPEKIIEKLIQHSLNIKAFGLMHYSRLMVESHICGETEFSNQLYKVWNRAHIDEYLIENHSNDHPFQIIFWKLGAYLMNTGHTKAAIKRYELANKICSNNEKSIVLLSISLAITAEETYYLSLLGNKYSKQCKKSLKSLRDRYEKLNSLRLPESMKKIFEKWDEVINPGNRDEVDFDKLYKLSREIAY